MSIKTVQIENMIFNSHGFFMKKIIFQVANRVLFQEADCIPDTLFQ